MRSNRAPIQLTSFIGRAHELEEVGRLIATARQITLTGTAGSGKTRLAIEIANRLSDRFPDGVWWVDLAPLRDPALLPQLVVHAFGLRPAADQPMLEALVSFVQPRQLLLILDNCEHLVAACAHLARQLLTEAPGLHLLATSREALANAGETIYPVSGLTCPSYNPKVEGAGESQPDLQACMGYDAVSLFVARARAIGPGFSLTVENAPAVVEICRRLDGLPLALELASARVNVLTVQEIAARLHDRLSLLTRGRRSALEPRHHTLRAAIDWSYTLLTTGEQTLLRRLAVFAAGFSLETTEAICSGEGILSAQVLDLLSSLVDKSLIIAETSGKASARYRLLETIREYALEKLYQAGEVPRLRDRHLALFMARAEEALPKQFEAYQQLWLNWLESEHDNLRAALSWALESQQIEAGLRLASALAYFWEIYGYVQEGLGWMERLFAEVDARVSVEVHVKAFVFATFHYMLLDDIESAKARARQAVEYAEAIGDADNPTLAFARDGLASAAKTAGDFNTAYAITEQNIRFYRQVGPASYLGMCLLAQGENAVQLGYYAIAHERLDESLALARQAGDTYRVAHSLNILGDLARLEGEAAEAARTYENGIALLRELGAQRDLASFLSNLGLACLSLGEVARAGRSFNESLAIHQSQQNRSGMTECLIGFAGTALLNGQPAAGVRLLAAADAISGQPAASKWKANQMEFERFLAMARDGLPEASFQTEQLAGRSLTLEQAVEFARQLQINPVLEPVANEKLGDLTARECEVAALIAQGKTNSQIAQELVLSKRTVEKHAANILYKLGLDSRAQVVRWAIEQGLIQASG